jgi:hypothetical protein
MKQPFYLVRYSFYSLGSYLVVFARLILFLVLFARLKQVLFAKLNLYLCLFILLLAYHEPTTFIPILLDISLQTFTLFFVGYLQTIPNVIKLLSNYRRVVLTFRAFLARPCG